MGIDAIQLEDYPLNCKISIPKDSSLLERC
jgi:hypothetical protein